MPDHEHEWEHIDFCYECGAVVHSKGDGGANPADYTLMRLARYVSPSVSSSDNLEQATFDLYETANMGTD